MDTLRKVKPGDPLEIPAETFNTFIDVAQAYRNRAQGTHRDPQHPFRQTGIVLVKNESGADRGRFNILGISAPIITPVQNADEFKNRVAMRGVMPTADHGGRFVVLIEPIATGALGRAVIDGITVAKVQMNDEEHEFADAEAGNALELVSSESGTAMLIWVEPIGDRETSSIAWAVVRVGGGGGGAGGGPVRYARITTHSGTGPYRYSAEEVTPGSTSDPTDFDPVSGSSATGDRFVNLAELQQTGACPARQVPNNTVVEFFTAPNGWNYFSFENQAGVYA